MYASLAYAVDWRTPELMCLHPRGEKSHLLRGHVVGMLCALQ